SMLKLGVGDSGSTQLTLSAEDGSEIPLTSVPPPVPTSNRVRVATARITDGRVVVTALAVGRATIVVKVGNRSTLLGILVEVPDGTPAARPPASAPAPTAATLARPSRPVAELLPATIQLHLVVGERDRLRVDAFDASHAVIADAGVRYLSLNRTVVQVDSISGEVTALAPGPATISATLPGTPHAIGVAVTVEAPQLRFEEDTFFVHPGVIDTLRLLPRSGQRAYRGSAVWTSSNPATVGVEPASGIVTALANGTASVTAQSTGWAASTTVVVVPKEGYHLFQATRDSTMFVPLGGSKALQGYALGQSQRDTLYPLRVEWRVADTSIVALDLNRPGLVALKTGSTELSARIRTIRADRLPEVYRWPVRVIGGAISLEPGRVGLRVGQRDTVDVRMLDSLNRPLTLPVAVEWRIDRSEVVRQVGPGIFEAIGAGRATISARTSWDSTALATVVVAPDLLFAYGSKPAAGVVREVRGLDLRSGAVRTLGSASGREEQPAVSPDRTRILYVSRVGIENSDIWLMDADGTNRVNLTADPFADFSPAWSADGSRLFYLSTRNGVRRVYQTDPSGSTPRLVTDSTMWVQSVATSPDGNWLVYSTLRGEQYDLYRIPLRDGVPTGAEERVVATRGNEVLPRYAARTGDLYYVQQERGGATGSVLMRLKTGATVPELLTNVSVRVLDLAVAPEGDRVVIVAYRPGDKAREPHAAMFLLNLSAAAAVLGAPLVDDPAASFSTPAFTP
ncbi:MAG: hypothetical protein SGI84_09800, partial [Gemmatimonadota bacterium]|nr:hypothetical protein [Gemmatimonadota bacterium]